jgi:hypothetical protein
MMQATNERAKKKAQKHSENLKQFNHSQKALFFVLLVSVEQTDIGRSKWKKKEQAFTSSES